MPAENTNAYRARKICARVFIFQAKIKKNMIQDIFGSNPTLPARFPHRLLYGMMEQAVDIIHITAKTSTATCSGDLLIIPGISRQPIQCPHKICWASTSPIRMQTRKTSTSDLMK